MSLTDPFSLFIRVLSAPLKTSCQRRPSSIKTMTRSVFCFCAAEVLVTGDASVGAAAASRTAAEMSDLRERIMRGCSKRGLVLHYLL